MIFTDTPGANKDKYMSVTRYYKDPKVVLLQNVNGGDAAVLTNKDSHASRVFKLNSIGAEIISMLARPRTREELIAALSEKYPGQAAAITSDVPAYLEQLCAGRLLKTTEEKARCILLVYPFSRKKEFTEPVPPLGLLLLAESLQKAGHSVEIYDFQLPGASMRDFFARLEQIRYDAVGFSVNTVNAHEAVMLAGAVKLSSPDTKIIFGGPHVTFEYARLLADHPQIDLAVLGEAENSIAPALDYLFSDFTGDAPPGTAHMARSLLVKGEGVPPPVDLDSLGLLDLSRVVNLRHHRDYPAYPLMTSRGCPFNCAYCASPAFWGRTYRRRDLESVMREVRQAKERYGYQVFKLEDDTITADRKRLMEFCRAIKHEGVRWVALSRVEAIDQETVTAMRASGCYAVFTGIESLDVKVLETIHKSRNLSAQELEERVDLCVKAGMRVDLSFILGLPGETTATAAGMLEFCRRIKSRYSNTVSTTFNFITMFPGTELSRRASELGYSRVSIDRTESLIGPTWASPTMSAGDMWRVFTTNLLNYSELKYATK